MGGGRRKKSTVAPAPQHNFGQERTEVIDRDRDRERRMSLSDNCGQEKAARERRASLAKLMQENTKQEKTLIAGPAPQQEKTEKPVIAGRKRRVSVSGRKRR